MLAFYLPYYLFTYFNSRLEELHSLEYRRDAELFSDQEQRHMSQMQLHKNRQNNSITPNSHKTTGKKTLINNNVKLKIYILLFLHAYHHNSDII